MPLSKDEQRRLDEIERALYRDDPKFAAGQSIERFRRRRMVMAGAAAASGSFVCPAAWVRDVMSPLEVVALR